MNLSYLESSEEVDMTRFEVCFILSIGKIRSVWEESEGKLEPL